MLNMNWGAIPDLAYSVPATSNEALRTLCARLVAQLQPVNRAMLDKAIAAVDDPDVTSCDEIADLITAQLHPTENAPYDAHES